MRGWGERKKVCGGLENRLWNSFGRMRKKKGGFYVVSDKLNILEYSLKKSK